MRLKTLDLDTLRTLIVATDLSGFAEAANRLGRTPSAVSLQMKRLQEAVGSPLFRKVGRGLALTNHGEIALGYARRMLALNDELLHTIRGASLTGSVRLGFTQDFAESLLPEVLSTFSRLYPLVLIEVRIEGNAALVGAIKQGDLDVALAIGHEDRPTAQVIGQLDLAWIAGRSFTMRADRPLPLVMLGPQCAFRRAATSALEHVGREFRVAATSPSLAGLWASAIGGLGVTARSAIGVPAALQSNRRLFDLPALPSFPITLHTASSKPTACVDRLRTIVSDVFEKTLPTLTDGASAHRPRSSASELVVRQPHA
jgi:DNA-binding transcriptional LysR family regulator